MTRFGFSFSPPLRQYDILYIVRLFKQRGYFTVPEAGNATAYACDKEHQLGMLLSKRYELVDIRTDGFHASLHCRDGIALSLQTYALPHDGTKLAEGNVCSTTAMHSLQIAAKDENLVWL